LLNCPINPLFSSAKSPSAVIKSERRCIPGAALLLQTHQTLVSLQLHVLRCPPALAASVAELVDALDSKSSAERRAGSIPAGGTTSKQSSIPNYPVF
jgi:hypothetical protein